MMDDQDNAKQPEAKMGAVDMSWHDQQQRELALIKAVESRKGEDDDHAIIARAGRFLNFLKSGA